MSLGYAEKLSFIEDVGNVGMTEFFDSSHILQEKINQLAVMIQKSKHLVVFTGAGISTSCGIPDFRGPKGIWTLQKEGKAIPEASVSFHRATPSMTHMALVALEKAGILKFVISQNIDGLHLRSGISREKLAELHGNSFMEVCPSCGAEYLRDFEVGTIGLKETSRRCSNADCRAKLRDTVLDWEDALPDKEMNPAERHCKRADVVLCLGTSLQITPACNLPLKCLKGGGKIVIVNLQKTPKDKKASLVIHGLVDKVIAGVLDLLDLPIPPFVRIDLLQTILTQALSLDKKYVNWNLRVASIHGNTAPLPFVESVEIYTVPCGKKQFNDLYGDANFYLGSVDLNVVYALKQCRRAVQLVYLEKFEVLGLIYESVFLQVSFSENQTMKAAILDKQPFNLKRRTIRTAKPFDILLKLGFGDGCKCLHAEIKIPVDFQASTDSFEGDKNSIFQKLRDRAMKDPSCGQTALIEKKAILVPKSEIMVHSIVTDIVEFRQAVKDCPRPSRWLLDRQNGDANEIKITRKRSRSRKRSSSHRQQ